MEQPKTLFDRSAGYGLCFLSDLFHGQFYQPTSLLKSLLLLALGPWSWGPRFPLWQLGQGFESPIIRTHRASYFGRWCYHKPPRFQHSKWASPSSLGKPPNGRRVLRRFPLHTLVQAPFPTLVFFEFPHHIKHFGMRNFGMTHFGMKHVGMKHFGMKNFGMKHFGMKHFGMKHFGMKHFGMNHFGMKYFEHETLWHETLWHETLWHETL